MNVPILYPIWLAIALMIAPWMAHAEQVMIEGCPMPGIEAGCIMLIADGKTYNVTAAKPTPPLGVRGRVTGTISGGVSLCMQGLIVSPATWEPTAGESCPGGPTN